MKLDETIDFHIKSAWHALSRMYNRIAIQNGISQTVSYLLIHIKEEGTPITKIGPLLGMEPTSLSRDLKKIEKSGLIYRKTDSSDKRVIRIFLTEEGIKKRKLAEQTLFDFNKKLLEITGAGDIEKVNATLKKIKEFVQEKIDKNSI